MGESKPTTREFHGVHVQVESPLPFDVVLQSLRDKTGHATVPHINEVAAKTNSAEEFDAEVTRRYVGTSDFMVFAELDHTPWIAKYGITRRILRIILGNPLIAITMLREDLSAGLFVPVELLLMDNGAGSTLRWVRPSSLMNIEENPPLKKAALDLDRKLELLVSDIAG